MPSLGLGQCNEDHKVREAAQAILSETRSKWKIYLHLYVGENNHWLWNNPGKYIKSRFNDPLDENKVRIGDGTLM